MRRKLGAVLGLCLALAWPAQAQDEDAPSQSMARGRYFMKAGRYLKASEAFRVGVLERPQDTERILAFANSLFAVGNYHYASHAIRRAARAAGEGPFEPGIAALFPSQVAYVRALDDLKRYVTYNRRDPAALTVLAYTFYADGEVGKSERILGYLELLDREDPYVAFLRERLETREATPSSEPDIDIGPMLPPEPTPAPPAPAPEPKPAPVPPAKPKLTAPELPGSGAAEEQPLVEPGKPKPAIAE